MSSFRWSIDEDLAFYRSAGITTTGVVASKLAGDMPGGADSIRDAGLAVSTVFAHTVGTPLVAPGDDASTLRDVLAPSIDLASALGRVPCFFVTGPTPPRMPTDDAFALLSDRIGPAVAYARDVGVRLAVEPSSTSTHDLGFVHSLLDAVELADETELGVCVELQNCWFERHLGRLFEAHVERFVAVQVSDYTVGESARLNRRVPGDGDIPLEWLLGAVLDAGYGGPFELEIVGRSIETESYASAIERGLAWLSERLDRWGA